MQYKLYLKKPEAKFEHVVGDPFFPNLNDNKFKTISKANENDPYLN